MSLRTEISDHELPLARPFATSRFTLTVRRSLVLEVTDTARGLAGRGEATPLEEFGTESYNDARAALAAASFDLAVLLASGTSLAVTPQLLGDALRLLRPGGRCLVVMPGGAATEGTPPLVDGLRQAGFKASRELARREGLSFLEATKAS